MLKKLMNFGKDELVRGGIILFVMIGIFNFLNYLFHFAMARMLEPAEYGILVVLISISYIFAVPSEAVQTIFSKYTSKHIKDSGKVKDLLLRGMKKALQASVLIYLVFIPVAIFLSFFLNIELILVLLTGVFIFGSFVTPVIRGILQGEKKFLKLGVSLDLESLAKVLLAVLFVYLIKNVYSAILAVIASLLIGFIITLCFVRDILKIRKGKAKLEGIYAYSGNTFFIFLVIILVLGIDVILAKRFFAPELAGQYAVASLLGKIIFFGTNGIAKAMFPISSERNTKEKQGVFIKAALFTAIACLVALAAFALMPSLIVKILFGSQYVSIAGIIVFTGIAFSLLSFTNLMVYHKLSHGKIKNPYFMLVFVPLMILILWVFSQSLLSFSIALCMANLIVLAGSLFLKSEK